MVEFRIFSMADDCANGCQYSKDVDMYPQYVCAEKCQYLPTPVEPKAQVESASVEKCVSIHEFDESKLGQCQDLSDVSVESKRTCEEQLSQEDAPVAGPLKSAAQPNELAAAQASFEEWWSYWADSTEGFTEQELGLCEYSAQDAWNAQQAKIEALEKEIKRLRAMYIDLATD